MILLGVDGGGTKTACAAVTDDGELIGTAAAGPVNTNFVPRDAARAALSQSILDALGSAGAAPSAVRALAVGGPMARDLVREVAGKVLPESTLHLVGEGELVLAAGGVQETGIALISGTGSIAVGRTGGRPPVTVGGWGNLMGDEGSAFDLGRRALQAVTRDADGRGPATALRETVLAWAAVKDARDLIRVVYRPATPPDRTQIASIAPLVTKAAAAGDAVALRITAHAIDELARHVTTLAGRLGLSRASRFSVVSWGGVLTNAPRVQDGVRRAVTAEYPRARVFVPEAPAAVGGAALALRLEGLWRSGMRRTLLGRLDEGDEGDEGGEGE